MKQLKISAIIAITVLFCQSSIPVSAGEQPKQHDPSLAISVDPAIRQHRKNRIFLVDVRSRKKFETLRVPGALNIPLYAVKTRPFLKSRPIVLVNAGFAGSLLKQECRQLNQKGFKASFLTGGLNAWSHRGGPLEGDLFAVQTLGAVSARIFHQEKDFKNTIVIDVSEVQSRTSKQLMPEATHLPTIAAAMKQPVKNLSLADLRASLKGIKKNPNAVLLITNQDGQGYEHIEKIIAKADMGSVFYLEGGLNGYSRFLNHLAQSRQPKNTRVKTIGECSTCGEKNEDERVE